MSEKARLCRRAQRKRYYARTAFLYERRRWTKAEDEMVIAHIVPDSELSPIIRRSMKSISNRRRRLCGSKAGKNDTSANDD